MVPRAEEFIAALTQDHDVIVIGGLAIIAHGFSRPTKDADVWLDPMDTPSSWALAVETTCTRFTGLTVHTLPGWRQISGSEIAKAADEVGMVRILGLECPLVIFRRPNEFPIDSFPDVLSRCTRNRDRTWLPDPIDLAITKDMTNREKDQHDIWFLESLVRNRWIKLLPQASREEAEELLSRFVDWQTCEAALLNNDPAVREMALTQLREFADEGDPFSQAILDNKSVPPP